VNLRDRRLPVAALLLGISLSSLAAQQKPAPRASQPSAQSRPDEKPLVEARDNKLKAEFLKKAAWFTDYDKALAEAKKGNKLVFVYFTRTYQSCASCTAFEAGTLSDPKFPDFARHVVPFMHVTSMVSKDAHQDLHARKGGGTTFPHLVFLDAEGNLMGKLAAFDRSLAAINTALKKATDQAKSYQDQKKRAESGDRAAKINFFMTQLELGHLSLEEARAKLPGVGQLSFEQSARVGDLLASLEVPDLIARTREKKNREVAIQRLLEIRKERRAPSDDDVARHYFACLLNHAEKTKNQQMFEDVLAGMRNRFGKDPSMKRSVETYEKMLAKLKQGN
jgi:hypothetical protein